MNEKLEMSNQYNDLKLAEKEVIKQFIKTTFKKYEYDRMMHLYNYLDFKNYEHFINHNVLCVNNLSDSDTACIFQIITMIQRKAIFQCDEEDFSEYNTYSIYFNPNKKLVLVHPR